MTAIGQGYTYVSCVPISLLVTHSGSPFHGNSVLVLGRYQPTGSELLLLVQQTSPPHLLEIPASHTNVEDVTLTAVAGDCALLDLGRVLQAAHIVEAVMAHLEP